MRKERAVLAVLKDPLDKLDVAVFAKDSFRNILILQTNKIHAIRNMISGSWIPHTLKIISKSFIEMLVYVTL